MRLRSAALGCALVTTVVSLASTATADPPAHKAFTVEEHRLPNGLLVRLAPDDGLDDVSVAVRYRVGWGDDPQRREGLAHLVEHMMFNGSRHVAPGDHARLIERAGGYNLNARTERDWTIYYETIPASQLPLALWLESDRMGFAEERVDEKQLAKEHALVSDERRDKILDSSTGTYYVALNDFLYPPWHPYFQNEDEEIDDASVDAITVNDVRAFMQTWYSPANATLAIAGHFDPKVAMDLVTRYFATLPATQPPARPALPPWRAGLRVDYDARLTREYLTIAWPTAPVGTADDRALDVVAAMLVGPYGRLTLELLDGGSVLNVHARQGSHEAVSEFHVDAVVSADDSVDRVAKRIEDVIASFGTTVDTKALAAAKRRWARGTRLSLETGSARAFALTSGHLDLQDPFEIGARSGVTAVDVQRVARTWLAAPDSAMIVVHRSGTVRGGSEIVRRTRRTK